MKSPGSRCSKATFHCLMVARSRPLPEPGNASRPAFGERMKTPGGSVTLPELRSGTTTGGMLVAKVVTELNVLAELLKLMSKGNDPRIGRDQGSGLIVWP